MKILVYHNLPPGGAWRVALEQTRHLARRHEVHVACVNPSLGRFVKELGRHGVLVGPGPPLRLSGAPRIGALGPLALMRLTRIERVLARAVDTDGYDFVLVHPCRLRQTPDLVRFTATRTVLYLHEPRRRTFDWFVRRQSPPLTSSLRNLRVLARRVTAGIAEPYARRGDRLSVRAADSVLCNSVHTRERIRSAYGVTARLCRLGVDTDVFQPTESSVAAQRYILGVGGLEPWKGHRLVIHALSLVPLAMRPSLRIVTGRGSVRGAAELMNLARHYGVDLDVEIGISDTELAARYEGAIATVCAASLEPFGLTTLESMATGTPVIAIEEGGYREVVLDGVNGLLVSPDRRSLAKAIAEVAAGHVTFDRAVVRSTLITGKWTLHEAHERLERCVMDDERLDSP